MSPEGESIDPDRNQSFCFDPIWELTKSEVSILQVLLSTDIAEKNDLLRNLYGDSFAESTANILKVFIHHIRRKTARSGMKIRTIYGVGYSLSNREEWLTAVASDPQRQ